jgi:tripartite-type tricarboxylate transporter receptor subunit TctC
MAARALRCIGAAMVLLLGRVDHSAADEVERFYAGRKLSVVIGHEAGTGFDLYGRALARHLGRFIPGNPTLVPENMPGAAGFSAANWLFNAARIDCLRQAAVARS